MSKKQKIIVSITGIFLVFLILAGLTYAYYLTKINGNTNTKSISVDTANLELVYGDGNGLIEATNIVPGQEISQKTFTVTNSGNATVYGYGVYLESVVNTLSRKSDMVYTLTCTSSVSDKTCNGVSETTFPSSETLMVSNNINASEVQSYTLTVTYKNLTTVDQSEDMDKEISAKVNISASQTNSKSLYEMLLLVNGTPTVERSNFNKIYTENTASDHGFYKTTENGTNVYYFAGTEKYQTGCYGVDTGKYYDGVTESDCGTTQGSYCSQWIDLYTTESTCTSNSGTWSTENRKWYQKATIDNWVKFGNYKEDTYLLYNSSTGSTTVSSTNCNPDTNENCIKLASAGDDMYWRIIRTNSDGSVKLLYHGTSVNDTHSYIDISPYSSTASNISYKSSIAKTVIDNWVAKNLNDHFNQINTTATYCNETTQANSTITGTDSVVVNAYTSYARFATSSLTSKDSIVPTLNCSDSNKVSGLSAGLMTIDELSLAGGVPDKVSLNLWYFRNAFSNLSYDYTDTDPNDENATVNNFAKKISSVYDKLWYTMSPHSYSDSNQQYISLVYSGRRFPSTFLSLYKNSAARVNISGINRVIRPTISLNSNAKVISGDGTSSNPYVISNSDTNKICNPITVATSGSYTVGDEYSCLVDPDHTPYNFYVISSDSSNVTMIMDSNICSNGQATDGTVKCATKWTDATDYSKGPNLALDYLNTATSGWTNLKNINATHEDESTLSIKTSTITFSGKARFLYKSEYSQLYNLGKLSILRTNLTTTKDSIMPRYYTADTQYNTNVGAYNVTAITGENDSGNVGVGIGNTSSVGVRPVIVVPKSKFSN